MNEVKAYADVEIAELGKRYGTRLSMGLMSGEDVIVMRLLKTLEERGGKHAHQLGQALEFIDQHSPRRALPHGYAEDRIAMSGGLVEKLYQILFMANADPAYVAVDSRLLSERWFEVKAVALAYKLRAFVEKLADGRRMRTEAISRGSFLMAAIQQEAHDLLKELDQVSKEAPDVIAPAHEWKDLPMEPGALAITLLRNILDYLDGHAPKAKDAFAGGPQHSSLTPILVDRLYQLCSEILTSYEARAKKAADLKQEQGTHVEIAEGVSGLAIQLLYEIERKLDANLPKGPRALFIAAANELAAWRAWGTCMASAPNGRTLRELLARSMDE